MRILLIGANGNLGGELQKIFVNEELTLWDKDELDITNRDMVFSKVAKLQPKIIINAAAYNAVDICEENSHEFEIAKKINGDAPGYLAEISLKINALFIHYSSDYVFDGIKKSGYTETDQPNPINNYGQSKLLGEEKTIEQAAQGLKFYIIRTSKLFGPIGKSEVSKPSFFDIMLKLSKTRDKIDVVDSEVSCFTYTSDLAKATKKLIDNNKISGIYHIINEGACTWFESVVELFKIKKIDTIVNPVSPDKFPRPAKRPEYSVLKNTKLSKLRTYQEALKSYLEK